MDVPAELREGEDPARHARLKEESYSMPLNRGVRRLVTSGRGPAAAPAAARRGATIGGGPPGLAEPLRLVRGHR